MAERDAPPMPPALAFLDDDPDVRDALRDLAQEALGVECLTFGSLEELGQQRERVLASRVALLDVNLGPGQPSGLDAYVWLKAQGYTGRVVFLTGFSERHPIISSIRRMGDAYVLMKPVSSSQLATLLNEAMGT